MAVPIAKASAPDQPLLAQELGEVAAEGAGVALQLARRRHGAILERCRATGDAVLQPAEPLGGAAPGVGGPALRTGETHAGLVEEGRDAVARLVHEAAVEAPRLVDELAGRIVLDSRATPLASSRA